MKRFVVTTLVASGLLHTSGCTEVVRSECQAFIHEDHETLIANLAIQTESITSQDQMKSWLKSTVMMANESKDSALVCMKILDGPDRDRSWNVSFAYRVLAESLDDFQSELDNIHASSAHREISVRIDDARRMVEPDTPSK